MRNIVCTDTSPPKKTQQNHQRRVIEEDPPFHQAEDVDPSFPDLKPASRGQSSTLFLVDASLLPGPYQKILFLEDEYEHEIDQLEGQKWPAEPLGSASPKI